jgi:tetratricopeptide (TPR) repeat protein
LIPEPSARIDRIEVNLKRVIQIASVIGREFAFRILQKIMDMQDGIKPSLVNLQGLEFISEKRLFPELEYIFKHAITQEVAYNSLLQRRRKEIHEKIGKAIESLYPERLEDFYELLAHHYGRSDNMSKALDYLELANQKAASRLSALEEAKAYFYKAMAVLDTFPNTKENRQRRLSLLGNQFLVFFLLHKIPEYYTILKQYEPIASESKDQRTTGKFWSCMGACEWYCGRFDEAIHHSNRAIELFEGILSTADTTAFAYFVLAWIHLYNGDLEKVLIYKEEGLRVLEQDFNLRWFVWLLCGGSWAYSMLGRWDQAVTDGEKALRMAEEYSSDSLICFAAYFISWALTSKGELDEAVEYYNLAVEKAPTPADKVWAEGRGTRALSRAGQPEKAVEIWKRVLSNLVGYDPTDRVRIHQISQWHNGVSNIMIFLGEAYWLIGNYHEARQCLLEGLRIAEECKMRYLAGWAHRLLGEVALIANPSEAAIHFEKSISILQEVKGENELALSYSGYGRFHKQQGHIKQAREYLTNALGIFERLGTLIEPEKVKRELAELPGP